MFCDRCGTEAAPGSRFCQTCGSPIPSTCVKCGAQLGPEVQFCAACGAPVAQMIATGAAPRPVAAPAAPAPSGSAIASQPSAPEAVAYHLSSLRVNVAARRQTDRRLYLLTDGILLPVVTLGIWPLVVFYRLIKRRDEHFRRENAMNRDFLQMLWRRVESRGFDPRSMPEMAALQVAMREKEELEQARGAGLWLVLGLVTGGLAWLYPYWFLTVDFHRHEQRQYDILEKANAVLDRIGSSTLVPHAPELPERHFWFHMIAIVLTLGLWGIVWYYRILSDPNRHFESQAGWEDGFAEQIAAWW